MHFFKDSSEAERYATSRPYFHPIAIDRAKKAASMQTPTSLALDVACGTGHSTTALMALAEQVIGIDISFNMLLNARNDARIRYLQAPAESIPLRSGSVPIVSTALAFHWFDRDRFLREAWRVLTNNGLLFVYTNGFTGTMREDPEFQNWSRRNYPERFPTPPRASKPLTPEEAAASGFAFIAEERYENDIRFTAEELVAYLVTQTNVMAAVERGQESIDLARQWLLEQVRPYFTDFKATFVFATRAWYLRKEDAHKHI